MADFTPENNAMTGLMAATAEAKMPEVKLPEVGDTLRVLVHPWGHYQVLEKGMAVPADVKVLELELKSVKTAKVIFE